MKVISLKRLYLTLIAVLLCSSALALTICRKCGHEVDDGAEKCSHCKALVVANEAPPGPAPVKDADKDDNVSLLAEEFVKEQYRKAQENQEEKPGLAFAYYQNAFAVLRLVPADERSERVGQAIMKNMNLARKAMCVGKVPCHVCKGTGKYKVDLGKVDGSKNVKFVEGINCKRCDGLGWRMAHLSVDRIKMNVLKGRQAFEQKCMVDGYRKLGRAYVTEELLEKLDLRQRAMVMTGIPSPCKECQYTGLDVCRDCKGTGWVECPAENCKDGVIELPSSSSSGYMKKKRLNGEVQEKCGVCQGWGEIPCRSCQGSKCCICEKCGGTGESPRCSRCSGTGLATCTRCNGTGRYKEDDCDKCSGAGQFLCPTCKGEGSVSR